MDIFQSIGMFCLHFAIAIVVVFVSVSCPPHCWWLSIVAVVTLQDFNRKLLTKTFLINLHFKTDFESVQTQRWEIS